MNNEIILRLRSPEGQNRVTVKAGDTFGELMLKVYSLSRRSPRH